MPRNHTAKHVALCDLAAERENNTVRKWTLFLVQLALELLHDRLSCIPVWANGAPAPARVPRSGVSAHHSPEAVKLWPTSSDHPFTDLS